MGHPAQPEFSQEVRIADEASHGWIANMQHLRAMAVARQKFPVDVHDGALRGSFSEVGGKCLRHEYRMPGQIPAKNIAVADNGIGGVHGSVPLRAGL